MVLVCAQRPGESHEDDAYRKVSLSRPASLIAAIRHYLHKMIADPVSALTLVLAISTIGLWFATRHLWEGAEAQTGEFKKSIDEAARSATAMEGVAASMAINATKVVESVKTQGEIAARQKQLGEMQMRAYLSAAVGGATYQERAKGWKFAGQALLNNTGSTAAKKVVHQIRAAIVPNDHVLNGAGFTLDGAEWVASGIIAPHANATIEGVVLDFVDDLIVEGIKRADGSVLCLWGLVTYEDVFGTPHWLKFGHRLTWRSDGRVFGNFLGEHNDTDD